MSNSSAPIFDPAAWSDFSFGQTQTNCYEYVLQNDDFLIHNPGTLLGHSGNTGWNTDSFETASNYFGEMATGDGLVEIDPAHPTPEGFYRVALYVSFEKDVINGNAADQIKGRFVDYHWVREDADGGLSHKAGFRPPERLERPKEGGFPLTVTSITEDYRIHYDLAREFIVPEGGIDVGIDAFLKTLPEEARQEVCKIGDNFSQLKNNKTALYIELNDPPEGAPLTNFLKNYNNCENSNPLVRF